MTSGDRWLIPPPDTSLSANDLHVWRVNLIASSEQVQRLWALLTPDEQARAERFYFDRDRIRFVITRGVLRVVIGNYLAISPKKLRFQVNSHGKPALVPEKTRIIQFNVTHSHDVALLAFCRERAIGVDVEKIRPLPDAQRIAARFFSDEENAVFQTVPPAQQDNAFFSCWTRKEAFIKAVGDGLSYPLNQFDVTLAPDEQARFLRIRGSKTEAARWSLIAMTPQPGYVAAVAVPSREWRCSFWRWRDA